MKRRETQISPPRQNAKAATPHKTNEDKRREALDRNAEHATLTTREKMVKAGARRGDSYKEVTSLTESL
jgi:hypothetical protein